MTTPPGGGPAGGGAGSTSTDGLTAATTESYVEGMHWTVPEDMEIDLSDTSTVAATGTSTAPEVEASVTRKAVNELVTIMAREQARAWRDRDTFEPPTDLPTDGSDWLDTVDEPLRYAVQGALNILYGEVGRPAIWTVSAMFKFGKTTFFADFVKCAADGEVFGGPLGFKINLDEGRRIVHTNYEVADRTLRVKWYRPLAISNRDRFAVMSLRPAQVRLASRAAADWMVEQLRARAAQIWIVDTFSRCGALDGSENSNEDVNAAYDRLLEIGARAGVELVVVVDHMGKSGGSNNMTARGATSKQDYPDDFSTGHFTDDADLDSDRIISTRGRSDDAASSITYRWDRDTRRHVIVEVSGYKSAEAAKADAKIARIDAEILAVVDTATGPMVKAAIKADCSVGSAQERGRRIDALIADGTLERVDPDNARSPIRRRVAVPATGVVAEAPVASVSPPAAPEVLRSAEKDADGVGTVGGPA